PGGAYPPDRFKGRRIRCKALLSSSHPNDLGREFVITYDLGLDTLMVHELQRRNSGRPGGLFLVKGRHRRPASNGNGRYYVPQDLYLGASVPLATGHTLVVTEMDRASLAICEEFPRDFPLMDSDRILRRLKTRAQQTALNLRSELRHRAETAQKLRCSARFSNNQAAATAPPAPGATAMLSGWTAGKGFVGNGGTLRRGITSNASSTDGGCGGGRGGRCEGEIAAGSTGRQRARSGATWGLVGGWGDCPGGADEGARIRRGVCMHHGCSLLVSAAIGSPATDITTTYQYTRVEERGGAKSAGSPAPWATVHGVPAAAVARDRGAKGRSTAAAARGGVAGGEVAERIERGAVVAFEDEEAFRDAMDELGLLVGLGQQEVLTLVR
ncbi:unnamed protein product, partial [Sphacelaria rigidula]